MLLLLYEKLIVPTFNQAVLTSQRTKGSYSNLRYSIIRTIDSHRFPIDSQKAATKLTLIQQEPLTSSFNAWIDLFVSCGGHDSLLYVDCGTVVHWLAFVASQHEHPGFACSSCLCTGFTAGAPVSSHSPTMMKLMWAGNSASCTRTCFL